MASTSDANVHCPTRREVFDASFAGAQHRPFIPRLRSDPPSFQPVPRNLAQFRVLEGKDNREHRLKQVYLTLPKKTNCNHDDEDDDVAREHPVESDHSLTPESAQRLEEMYQDELLSRFRRHTGGFLHRNIGWPEFEKYAEAKEAGACLPPSCLTCIQITTFAVTASTLFCLLICMALTSRALAYLPPRTRS